MKTILSFLFLALPGLAWSQAGSEIFVFDVKTSKEGISLNNPINVTNHPGYDNQPHFHSDNTKLYYSSFNEDGRSDIKTYDFASGKTTSFTQTSEREYSPTLTPDGKFISCIIQRDNDAQDLGKYPLGGGGAITLIDNLIVGYHAWVDENNLILFVLGEPMTLRWYDLNARKDEVIAENIGRSLHNIPGEGAMSFVHKKSEGEWVINRLDNKSKEITTITTTLSGREDLTWMPDGKIVMSDGGNFFVFDQKKSNQGWVKINVNADAKLTGITRLAISADGKKLAVVAAE